MGRPKEHRIKVFVRVNPATHETVKTIAKALGLTYAREGSLSQLLDAIAAGEVIIIKTPSKG